MSNPCREVLAKTAIEVNFLSVKDKQTLHASFVSITADIHSEIDIND